MKKLILLACVLAVPAFAQQNNIGSCGWGSRLFKGEKGIAPQVLAATTNGTSGNQTFAITSGTSGCTQEGVVTSSWKAAAYIDSNMNKLARDTASGQGESLQALASLYGMEGKDQAEFFSVAQANFARIFPNAEVASPEVAKSFNSIIAENATLARYAHQG